jgi:radical SAM superfamily enzyme YgiQ (UPF0313 family)
MNTLLVHPAFPKTYWGMEYARLLTKKSALLPPLGLLTVAALLPPDWCPRLVDMSVEPLTDEDLAWADVVFVGAMQIQQASYHEVIRRAHSHGKTVVVGGAYATTDPDASTAADCIVIGESEELIGPLCRDLENGTLQARYEATQRPDVTQSPIPRFDLLQVKAYQCIGIQFSRGCPFNCEFCDIIEVFGRVPRTKSPEQLLREFDAVYASGFHAMLFLVDDNFIGNKRAAKLMLPKLADWMQAHDFPFDLFTEASINLAADDRLIELMVQAGFSSVFIGIETPSQESLAETQKVQNLRLDLTAAVEKLTRKGLEIMAGFIIGFDADDVGIFERQRAFIQNSPIPLAMVGLLSALPGTQLWRRLESEGRLFADWSGENFGCTNFKTRMPAGVLLDSYGKLLADLYTPNAYFARCLRVLELWPLKRASRFRFSFSYALVTFARIIWRVGVRAPYRNAFWRFMGKAMWRTPSLLVRAISQVVNGEHVIRFTTEDVMARMAQTRAERVSNATVSTDEQESWTALRPGDVLPFVESSNTAKLVQLSGRASGPVGGN